MKKSTSTVNVQIRRNKLVDGIPLMDLFEIIEKALLDISKDINLGVFVVFWSTNKFVERIAAHRQRS